MCDLRQHIMVADDAGSNAFVYGALGGVILGMNWGEKWLFFGGFS